MAVTVLDVGEPRSTTVPHEGAEREVGRAIFVFRGRRKGQAVADGRPQQRDQTRQREALHGRGQHVLHAHTARVVEHDAGRGHEHHHHGAQQHPLRVRSLFRPRLRLRQQQAPQHCAAQPRPHLRPAAPGGLEGVQARTQSRDAVPHELQLLLCTARRHDGTVSE